MSEFANIPLEERVKATTAVNTARRKHPRLAIRPANKSSRKHPAEGIELSLRTSVGQGLNDGVEAASRTWPGVSRYQIIGSNAIAPSNTEDELTSPACDIFEDSQEYTEFATMKPGDSRARAA